MVGKLALYPFYLVAFSQALRSREDLGLKQMGLNI